MVAAACLCGSVEPAAAASARGTGGRAVGDYAVVVGISNYPGTGDDLEFCDDDAFDVRDVLVSRAGFDPANVYVLTDAAATKAAVQSAITEWLDTREDASSRVVFYFSGHGTHGTDLAPIDESDGQDEYIHAHDYSIRDDELEVWLDTLESTQVVVAIDSCYSGGFLKSRFAPSLERDLSARVSPNTAPAALKSGDDFVKDLNKAGRLTIASSDSMETSVESGTLQNGVFTFFFLEAFDFISADANSDGQVSCEEAFTYCGPRVQTWAGHMPQMYDGVNGEVALTVPAEAENTAYYEPNDTWEQAEGFPLQTDTTCTAYCERTGDLDGYCLSYVRAGSRVSLDLSSIPLGTDYDLYLFGPDRRLVEGSGAGGSTPEHLSVTVAQSGLFYVQVRPEIGSSPADAYNLRAHIKPTARMYRPVTRWLVRRGRYFTVYGYLKPRHPSWTRLYFYRLVNGRWRWYRIVWVRNHDYWSYGRYVLRYRLPYAGRWCVKAHHSDGDHMPSSSTLRVFAVQ